MNLTSYFSASAFENWAGSIEELNDNIWIDNRYLVNLTQGTSQQTVNMKCIWYVVAAQWWREAGNYISGSHHNDSTSSFEVQKMPVCITASHPSLLHVFL